MNNSFLFAYLSAASILLPLFIGLVQWKNLSIRLRIIVCLVVFSALSDLTSLILINVSLNSWVIVNLFFIIQFILFFLVFDKPNGGKWLRVFFAVLIVFSLVDYFFIESPLKFNANSAYLGGIFMIVIASRYLYQLLRDLPVEKIHDYPMLWVSFAVLIYFAGTLFLFLFNNYLMAHQPVNHQAIWILHNLLNLTKNGFLAIALWKNYRLRISSV